MNKKLAGSGWRYRVGFWAFWAVLVMAGWGMLGAAPAFGQSDPQFLIRYGTDGEFKEVAKDLDLLVRPNVQQSIYLKLKNPEAKKKKVEVDFKVNGALVGGKPITVNLGANEEKDLPLAAPTKELPKKLDGWQEVKKPLRFEIKSYLVDRNNKRTLLQTIQLKNLMLPSEYISVRESVYDSKKKTLTVRVAPATGFVGPPCRVKLELPRTELPAFVEPTDAKMVCRISADSREKELYVNGLEFRPKDSPLGLIYLTVDGVERAFIIRHDFSPKENPDTGKNYSTPRVRLNAAPYAVIGKKLPVRLQVDYAGVLGGRKGPDPDQVVLELIVKKDQDSTEKQFQQAFLPGRRWEKIYFVPAGPDGALVFHPVVRDWLITDLNTDDLEGLEGPRFLEARLLDNTPAKRKLTDTDQRVIQLGAGEDEVRKGLVDFRMIEFVKEMPQLVSLIPLPAGEPAYFGKGVVLKARVRHREFLISELYFLPGPPPADGKRPETAIDGTPDPKRARAWAGVMKVTDETQKTVKVMAVARGSFADGEVHVVKTPPLTIPLIKEPVADPSKVGSISGVIVYGERPQAKREVQLYDAKGQLKDKVTTRSKGQFRFKAVEPGVYKVFLFKKNSQQPGGEKDVKVEAGKDTKADIKASHVPVTKPKP
jgi:hypothetical protein